MKKNPSMPEPPDMPEIYRTAIRVSDVAGRDKTDARFTFRSPDEQLRQGKRFAEGSGGIHDDVASLQNADMNVSAFTKKYTERPGLMRHLADAKAGKFQHIVFAFTDRSSRGVADGILLYEAFRDAGVEVHYLDNLGSPETDENFETKRDFHLIISAEVSRRARKRTVQNIRQRTAEGLPHGVQPGWIATDTAKRSDDLSRYSIDPDRAASYRRIVQMRLEMHGFHVIAKTLNAEGFTTVGGAQFHASSVRQLLTENHIRLMQGDAHITIGTRTPPGRAASDTVWMTKVYPAIIDDKTADALRGINARLSKEIGAGSRGVNADTKSLLVGRIRCGACNGRMTSGVNAAYTTKEGETAWRRCYRCNLGKTAVNHPPGAFAVDADKVEDAVARVLRLALSEPPGQTAKPEPVKRSGRPSKQTGPTHESLSAEIERLKVLMQRGWMDVDEFEAKATPLRDQMEALRRAERDAGQPERYASALAAFANVTGAEAEGDTEADPYRAAWRRLILVGVESVETPVELPEGAECVTEGNERHKDQLLHSSGEQRRVCRVTLTWNVSDLGNVFYAPLYQRNWTRDRLIFVSRI